MMLIAIMILVMRDSVNIEKDDDDSDDNGDNNYDDDDDNGDYGVMMMRMIMRRVRKQRWKTVKNMLTVVVIFHQLSPASSQLLPG